MPHLISQVKVSNFRSIIDETFDLSEYNTLIGCNNIGKSNILNSIIWILRKKSLNKNDFYDISQPVVIEGTISGIDANVLNQLPQNQATSIATYINNGVLKIQRTQSRPDESVANIKLKVYDPNAINPAPSWVNPPTGFDNSLNIIFPEPIAVNAMEDATEDVGKYKTSTTIGKLLSEIFKSIEQNYSAQVTAALASFKDLLGIDGTQRVPELNDFDTQANFRIQDFFPGITIKADIPTPEIKEVFKSGTIQVFENNNIIGRDVSTLGHGAQRSIQMGLIKYLADISRQNATPHQTTLLLIDEPELYLHPFAIEIVQEALHTLSTQGYQVIIATHSPLLISKKDMRNTILVSKNNMRGTFKQSTLISAVRNIVPNTHSQSELLFSLSNSSYILFAESVILCEGRTEEALLPDLIKKIKGLSLGLQKCALTKVNGCANIRKSMDVLIAMGINVKSIVDLDYVFKFSIQDGIFPANDTDINACKTIMNNFALVATNNISIGTDGWPQKELGKIKPWEAFELLSRDPIAQAHIENLHNRLLVEDIWIWKSGGIELYLGLTAKNEAEWLRFVQHIEPLDTAAVISAYPDVNSCIQWLL